MRPWYHSAWRIISHPYEFFEEAVEQGRPAPATIVFLGALVIDYTLWWLVCRPENAASVNVLLTQLLLPLATYPLAVAFIYFICRILGPESRLQSFFSVWGYTYLPTIAFFGLMFMAYFIDARFGPLPHHPLLIFGLWAVISLIFLWKVLLLAITLRLAGNLNFRQIFTAGLLLAGVVGIYWAIVYHFQWWKVPFI